MMIQRWIIGMEEKCRMREVQEKRGRLNMGKDRSGVTATERNKIGRGHGKR